MVTRMDRIAVKLVVTAALLSWGMLGTGCAQPGQIVGGDQTLPAEEGSPGFLDRISSLEAVTENDAMRGILYLLDGKDDAEGFQQRVEKLRSRSVVSARWDYRADRAVSKGRLAYMIYQAAKMRGGVTLTLFGPSERYCLRELQFQGVISSGLPYTAVTGLEFVAILTRADTYIETGELPDLIKTARPGY